MTKQWKSRLKVYGVSALALGALVLGSGSSNVEAAEITYTVKAGDTLFEIAAEHLGNGWKYQDIASANGLANPNVIHVGQTLSFDDGTSGQATVQKEVVDEKAATPETPKETVKKEVVKSTPATGSVPEYVLKVVESEAGPSYAEKSKVFSVIVNRVNAGNWGGSDYMSVVKAPGQFQVTWNGMADNAVVSDQTRQAVADVLANGVTTNAQSFRASGDGVTNVFH